MHHLVELRRDERIELADARLDHRLGVARVDHRAVQHLLDELGDDVASEGALMGLGGGGDVVEDLIEELTSSVLISEEEAPAAR